MNPDTIEAVPFLVIMALIVAGWLVIGLRDRARARRDLIRFRRALDRWQTMMGDGRCAHVWRDPDGRVAGYHVCSNRLDHPGPHLDGITGAMDR